MSRPRILVCDDELLIRMWLEEHLREANYLVDGEADGAGLLRAFEQRPADLVLLDLRLPDGSGLDVLRRIRALDSSVPVIMITAFGEVQTAVRAVREGAHHFLEKPIQLPQLLLLIEQALETTRLRREVERLREGSQFLFADVTLVGRSLAMRRIAELVTRLATRGSTRTVLLRGESGTGKDLVAKAIHARGPRGRGPFVSVNCTALPAALVESELFGHEAGAYTDARDSKKGLFELADGGTLYLDEVGDMPKSEQGKLLGVIEAQRFRRVGGVRDIEVDVQLIAATNRDLESAVAHGEFREDLFYRLNVVPIELPPLRERPEDVAPLAVHFVELLARELRTATPRLSREAMSTLENYDWPGNVRQLRNVLERILILQDVETIEIAHLPEEIRGASAPPRRFVLPPSGLSLDEVERELMCQALERADGNKTGAARLLGLTRDTFRYRLEKYGID